MDYAQQQRNPAKHLVGIAVVILLHIALVYALVNGLARKVVEVIKKPLETQIIEEIKPPPPPPPEVQLPPPPKMLAPPPPPEVQVNVPPPPNTIAVQSTTPPPESPPIAVRAPIEAPPAPPAPQSARTACTNYAKAMGDSAFPRDAIRDGIEKGEAVVRFTVDPGGKIKDIQVVRQTHRSFGRAAASIVETFQCAGQGRDIIFEVPFGFKRE